MERASRGRAAPGSQFRKVAARGVNRGRCQRTVEKRLAFAHASGSVNKAKSIEKGASSSKAKAQEVGRLTAKVNV